MRDKHHKLKSMGFAELMEKDLSGIPFPNGSDRPVGPWVYDREHQALGIPSREYWFPIERMTSAGEVLDMAQHVGTKPWGTDEVVGQLVRMASWLFGTHRMARHSRENPLGDPVALIEERIRTGRITGLD